MVLKFKWELCYPNCSNLKVPNVKTAPYDTDLLRFSHLELFFSHRGLFLQRSMFFMGFCFSNHRYALCTSCLYSLQLSLTKEASNNRHWCHLVMFLILIEHWGVRMVMFPKRNKGLGWRDWMILQALLLLPYYSILCSDCSWWLVN